MSLGPERCETLVEAQLAIDAWEIHQQLASATWQVQELPMAGMNGHALQNVREHIAAASAYTSLGRGKEAELILTNLTSVAEQSACSFDRWT